MKPFRFGVNVGPARSRTEWQDKARRIAALGYDTLTVPDHLADFLAPIPALVSAAEAAPGLRIGTNVLNNDFRHPVLAAREAATLDLLTDGRLLLGLGAGNMQAEYDQAGLAFDAGGTRVARLAEGVHIIRRLLDGETVSFVGKHYRVAGHTIAPTPIQRPHPPILIGGNGRRLLSLAAREADIVGFSGITFGRDGAPPDLSAWRVPAVEQRMRIVREAAGDRYARLELSVLVQRVVITDRRQLAAEDLARRWTQLSADEILHSPYALIGTVDQMADELVARRDRWRISDHQSAEKGFRQGPRRKFDSVNGSVLND